MKHGTLGARNGKNGKRWKTGRTEGDKGGGQTAKKG